MIRGQKIQGDQNVSGAQKRQVGLKKKSGTHKFKINRILIIIMPMYEWERAKVLVTASSHLKGQVHKSI